MRKPACLGVTTGREGVTQERRAAQIVQALKGLKTPWSGLWQSSMVVKSMPHILARETRGDQIHTLEIYRVGSRPGKTDGSWTCQRGKQTESFLAPEDRVGMGITHRAVEGF